MSFVAVVVTSVATRSAVKISEASIDTVVSLVASEGREMGGLGR